MEKEELKIILNELTLDSGEVKEILGIKRSSLAGYKQRGTLVPLKGNLYWRVDVEARCEKKMLNREESEKQDPPSNGTILGTTEGV
jgi:hypothetical protein